jgi:hypothetical protein
MIKCESIPLLFLKSINVDKFALILGNIESLTCYSKDDCIWTNPKAKQQTEPIQIENHIWYGSIWMIFSPNRAVQFGWRFAFLKTESYRILIVNPPIASPIHASPHFISYSQPWECSSVKFSWWRILLPCSCAQRIPVSTKKKKKSILVYFLISSCAQRISVLKEKKQ